ncbi:MAG: GTP-binding protein, partial [Myxococcales bacterium]|nr:GTP-binding protein [Myxococcales bacterium]
DDGSATLDWMTQEQERGITITAAATSFPWRDHQVNLIDTPGHVDFTVEVERSLRVIDGGIAVLCGVRGVESQTETVWRQADAHHVPRVAYVNKMDRPGADFEATLQSMRDRLGATPVAVQLPIIDDAGLHGVIDLVEMQSVVWGSDPTGRLLETRDIDAIHQDAAMAARDTLVDAVAAGDDDVLAAWLDGTLNATALRAGLRRATLAGRLIPTLCGASRKNRGVQPLLDAVVDYLPSPLDVAAASPNHFAPSNDPSAPLAMLAFKVQRLSGGEPACFVRIYAGTLRAGDRILNVRSGIEAQVSRVVKVHARDVEDVSAVFAGDIAAIYGVGHVATGDTLTAPEAPLTLSPIFVAEPVARVRLLPATDTDAARLPAALGALLLEDPTLTVETDPESGLPVLAGMGELHLELAVERLSRESRIAVRAGRPFVALRETIRDAANGRIEVNRPVAAAPVQGRTRNPVQFAAFQVELAPLPRGQGVTLDLSRSGLDKTFTSALEAGLREALDRGVLAGHPMTDVLVTVTDSESHPLDSTPAAFHAAGLALRTLLPEARPAILEPVMALEVVTPDACIGEVLMDLSVRHATVRDVTARAGTQVVRALVPLRSMFGYSTDLRSRTQGRATFSMTFDSFDVAAAETSDALAASARD